MLTRWGGNEEPATIAAQALCLFAVALIIGLALHYKADARAVRSGVDTSQDTVTFSEPIHSDAFNMRCFFLRPGEIQDFPPEGAR